jgi:hypothetical protein
LVAIGNSAAPKGLTRIILPIAEASWKNFGQLRASIGRGRILSIPDLPVLAGILRESPWQMGEKTLWATSV